MADRGGGVSLLTYTPAGVTGSDDDDGDALTLILTTTENYVFLFNSAFPCKTSVCLSVCQWKKGTWIAHG